MKYFTLARHYFFMTKFIYCNMELVLLSLVETFTEKQKISIKLRYWCKTWHFGTFRSAGRANCVHNALV